MQEPHEQEQKSTDVQDLALKRGVDEHYVEYRVNKKLLETTTQHGQDFETRGDQEDFEWNGEFIRSTSAKPLDCAEV